MEPDFEYMKASLHFTRLSVRGKEKGKNELGFSLLALNLRTYTAKGSQNKDLYFHFQKTRNENLFAQFSLLVSIFQDLCPQPLFNLFIVKCRSDKVFK
ncbi:hypothetical protein IBB82_14055 [Listeria seeligeri]|nr:hypothetical protein [Listeria seeligeri]